MTFNGADDVNEDLKIVSRSFLLFRFKELMIIYPHLLTSHSRIVVWVCVGMDAGKLGTTSIQKWRRADEKHFVN